jgi:hypothetical protein
LLSEEKPATGGLDNTPQASLLASISSDIQVLPGFDNRSNLPRKYPIPKVVTIAQISVHRRTSMALSKMLFAGVVMDTNQRQIALSVLEALREDLMYAHLNNGGRVLDVADLRQYIYEQMGRIRTNALVLDGLYGNDNGHGQDISKSNGHNGKAHS